MSSSDSNLFKPIKVGEMILSSRIAMAPLTRIRADDTHTLHDVSAEYYSQRASTPGSLIISEATLISPQACGLNNAPGAWSASQIEGWKRVVEAVHAKGSYIYQQLWHLGRAANAEQLAAEKGGPFDVISASDIPFEGGATPRSMTVEEIQQTVKDYAQAAKNFVKHAKGDGVEVHSANGYLLQQFLEKQSNHRTDQYGGSVEGRCRFPLEVLSAVVAAVGEKRTGIRISPYTTFQGMKMSPEDIKETYTYYMKEIRERFPNLSWIHGVEPRIAGNVTVEADEQESMDSLYDLWSPRPIIDAGGYKEEDAEKVVNKRENTIICYGRYYISNPDLVERLRAGIKFTPYDRDTFYIPGPENTQGYTDYPRATPEVSQQVLA